MASGRVAVVGAGLAGLSAGLELKRRGFQVELFERSRLLGGKATSFEIDGVEVDNGQHVFLACCTEFIEFVSAACAENGRRSSGEEALQNTLFLQDRFSALLLKRGAPPARLEAVDLPAPAHLLPAVARYRHIGLSGRLRIIWAMLDARRSAPPDETFSDWLDRHYQTEETRRAFWEPFMVPALNAPLSEVSAESALFVIRTAFLSDAGAARFGYAHIPLGRIAQAAARHLDATHLRTPVVGLAFRDVGRDGPSARTEGGTAQGGFEGVRLDDGTVLPFDGAVLAVPPNRLARLLGETDSLGVTGLEAFEVQPIVDVHLWLDLRDVPFDFAAVLDSPLQWVFVKGRGPDGLYLACSLSAAGQHVSAPVPELVELCRSELTAVLPELRGAAVVRSAATRDRDATFVPRPGLRRPGNVTSCPQVTIAGAWTDTGWPATMESAVRSGRAAARSLAGGLGHA